MVVDEIGVVYEELSFQHYLQHNSRTQKLQRYNRDLGFLHKLLCTRSVILH